MREAINFSKHRTAGVSAEMLKKLLNILIIALCLTLASKSFAAESQLTRDDYVDFVAQCFSYYTAAENIFSRGITPESKVMRNKYVALELLLSENVADKQRIDYWMNSIFSKTTRIEVLVKRDYSRYVGEYNAMLDEIVDSMSICSQRYDMVAGRLGVK